MFERYTEQARRALFFARSEMSELGGSSVDSTHLLAGILSDAQGAVRAIVGDRNITYARHRRRIASDQIPVEIEAVVEVRP